MGNKEKKEKNFFELEEDDDDIEVSPGVAKIMKITLIILRIMIIVLLIAIICVLIYKKDNKKDNLNNNNEVVDKEDNKDNTGNKNNYIDEEDINILSIINNKIYYEKDNTILDKIKGEYLWTNKDMYPQASGIYIKKNENNEYNYQGYQTHTGGWSIGVIKYAYKINETTYLLEIYYEAVSNGATEQPERTIYSILDISKIDNDILIFDTTSFKKYPHSFEDWENKDEWIKEEFKEFAK